MKIGSQRYCPMRSVMGFLAVLASVTSVEQRKRMEKRRERRTWRRHRDTDEPGGKRATAMTFLGWPFARLRRISIYGRRSCDERHIAKHHTQQEPHSTQESR